jgi:4-hydroxy-2-oxoheptanedioate aldolase
MVEEGEMHRKKNNVKECLGHGKISLGTWVQTASPEIVEAVGYQGYDFVIIDMEHGHFDFDTTNQMVRAADAAGITPVVRVPINQEDQIMKALDMGAMAVLVPGVGTKEQAERAVRASKYSPGGMRGACPWIRATRYHTDDWARHAQWSDEQTMIWLLVEGREGVRNFDDILTVPGIDAIMLGPFDLSQSLGIPGQLKHPLLIKNLQEMVGKARSRNIEVIAVMLSELKPSDIRASVQKWKALGCNIMVVGGDRAIICTGFKSVLTCARAAASGKA